MFIYGGKNDTGLVFEECCFLNTDTMTFAKVRFTCRLFLRFTFHLLGHFSPDSYGLSDWSWLHNSVISIQDMRMPLVCIQYT